MSGGDENLAEGTQGAWVGGGTSNDSEGPATSLLGGSSRLLMGAGSDDESEAGPTVFAP